MNFRKVGIVLGHEYTVRVKKKSFIILTLLTPLLMGLLVCVPALIMVFGGKDAHKVKIVDQSGAVASYFESHDKTEFVTAEPQESVETAASSMEEDGIYAVVGISGFDENGNVSVVTYSMEPINVELKNEVNRTVSKAVEEHKLAEYNIDSLDVILADIRTDVSLESFTLNEDGEAKHDTTEIYMGVAYVMSFLIYIFVAMFGSMVMRSVIEEKTSRVVEVIVSSVSSVELMFGKILGVALVALTQFLVWIILLVTIVGGVTAVAGSAIFAGNPEVAAQMLEQTGVDEQALSQIDGADSMLEAMSMNEETAGTAEFIEQAISLPWIQIIICFMLYFIFGYMLYASMYAAIGAAVDNEADTSQLSFPVTLPLIIGIFVMLAAFQNPSGSLAVWFSIIPFTSPMVMLARIPFGVVPLWQLALSLVILVLTFLVISYFAAKVYKAGILMYGKKSTFKDLWKWMKNKES